MKDSLVEEELELLSEEDEKDGEGDSTRWRWLLWCEVSSISDSIEVNDLLSCSSHVEVMSFFRDPNFFILVG